MWLQGKTQWLSEGGVGVGVGWSVSRLKVRTEPDPVLAILTLFTKYDSNVKWLYCLSTDPCKRYTVLHSINILLFFSS